MHFVRNVLYTVGEFVGVWDHTVVLVPFTFDMIAVVHYRFR